MDEPLIFFTHLREKTLKSDQHGYRYHKLRKAFSKLNRRHYKLVYKYDTELKTLLLQGLSEPELYGDLVYKLRKIVGKPEFSDHFSKFVISYKRKGYNIDVIKQSASLSVSPITLDHFVYLFNCTQVDRGSDSMMAQT